MDETIVVIVRAFITFFTLLIYTRILGKQQMGNLSFFDYINGITIGSISANLATDLTTKAWVHWVGLTTFILITLVLQFTILKNRNFAKVVASDPIIVIQGGKILEKNLKKLRITKDELMVLLRQQFVFNITEVEYAILEPTGNLSVLRKSSYRQLTPSDIGTKVQPTGLSVDIIYDGVILQENLQQRNKDKTWLFEQLHAEGISDIKEVSYAAILPNNTLYVDRFKDQISDSTNISDDQRN